MVTTNSLLKEAKGVLFHSPKGTSGYAEVGKRVVYQLYEQGVNISWYQFPIDDSQFDETDDVYRSAKKTINKNIEFDIAIFCCNPDFWHDHIEKYKIKYLKKKKIGYLSWETNKFPDLWVKYCNLMDEVWVPSFCNKDVLERCGVDVLIKVVPYPFIKRNLYERNSDTISHLLSISRWYGNDSGYFKYSTDWKVYYTIAEWSDRKNVEGTLTAFCTAFSSTDKVKLILKTHHIDYCKKNVSYCINQLETFLKKFPNHPEILLITENVTTNDIVLIHSIGDCFFSLSRGEGFCLDAWDASNYKKNVIITGFGGHCEYLDEKSSSTIGFSLINVNYKDKEVVYDNTQRWADPFVEDCVKKLKDSYCVSRSFDKTPVVLKSGWYFKEIKNGIHFRQSSVNSTLEINDQSYDFLKLKLRYENGLSTKNLVVLVDGLIKRTVVLTKNINQEILIPSTGVKKIEFSTEGSISEKTKQDCRVLGFLLESISLITKKSIRDYNVNEISIENELTEFKTYSRQEKDFQSIKDFNQNLLLIDGGLNSKTVQIRIKNESEFKGIVYIGQHGTSGYATATKGNLIYFFTKGIPISWIPLHFDNSEMSNECFYNAMVKSLIKKPVENYDTVFIHCTPDIWPEMCNRYKEVMRGRKIIGYTVWETNKLPYLWVESINDCVDEVWCPSTYNKDVFTQSGVTVPIKVFPHVFMPKELPSKESVLMNQLDGQIIDSEDEYYTFYNISELNSRKGIQDLVKTFCESFSSKDKVRLILKTHYKNYEEKNKQYCINVLNDILSSYEDPPKVHVILNNLTEQEILGLHSIGDCYISLCKSEGFGLTIFEAFNYGKKIIVTGYGGHLDFLGKNYEGLVKYKLGNVTGMNEFAKHYSEDQQWAYPDLKHAEELMKKIV